MASKLPMALTMPELFLPARHIRNSSPIADILHLPVLFLQLPLHLKVDLSFSLEPLLLHVADDALVHCLERWSVSDVLQYALQSHQRTAWSALCW